MTLIEIIIVIALLAGVMAVAMPQMFQNTEVDVQAKLGRLAGDMRSAFDTAVLSGKPYRIGFHLISGDYWLEEGPSNVNFKMGDALLPRDLSIEEEDGIRKEFDARFEEDYVKLAGETFRDPEDADKEIKPTSPVLKAKDQLMPPEWKRVESMEWSQNSVGSNLMITAMQAEHHETKQDYQSSGPQGTAYIYVFPGGYIERAYLVLHYTAGEGVPDMNIQPYMVVTDPNTGTVTISSGEEEVDVHAEKR